MKEDRQERNDGFKSLSGNRDWAGYGMGRLTRTKNV